MNGRLADTVWPDVDAGPRRALAVPLGSCEQHGPHLPLGTDTLVACALVDALVDARPDTVVAAPPLAITASGEHAGFPGTLSIGTAALTQVLVEVVRSADWADGVVFVNGHGGNADAVTEARRRLEGEGRQVLAWWPPSGPGLDAHAGHTETSLLLHLAPHLVRLERAVPGETRPLSDIADRLRAEGVRAVTPTGVLGDPTGARADAGAVVFAAWVNHLVTRFDSWAR